MPRDDDWNNARPPMQGKGGIGNGRGLIGGVCPAQWAGKPIPKRRWVVDGLIPVGSVTMISGDGAVGKTLLALQLIAACALGRPWLGFETMQCRAMGVHCEDNLDELHIRNANISRGEGFDLSELEDAMLFCRKDLDNMLVRYARFDETPPEVTAVYTGIMNYALDHGFRLIVLDSLYNFFPGNENNRPQVQAFVSELGSMASEIDGAVVLLSHPSVAGMASGTGTSGSTAWNNAVRSRLYMTKPTGDEYDEPDPDVRYLQLMKANYADTRNQIKIRWKDGVFVPEFAEFGLDATIAKAKIETDFLSALEILWRQGRHISDSRQSSNYAPKVLVALPNIPRHSYKEWLSAMERLFAKGAIRIGEITNSNRKKRAAIVRTEWNLQA